MSVVENLYPALVGVCGALLGVGAVLLVAPAIAPAPVAELMRSLPEMWVFPVVLLGIGGSFLMLLAFRSLL